MGHGREGLEGVQKKITFEHPRCGCLLTFV